MDKMRIGHQGFLNGCYRTYLEQSRFASASSVYYWAQKVTDESFYPGMHGGLRLRKSRVPWVGERFDTLQNIVRAIFDEDPEVSFSELISVAHDLWPEATEWGVRRVLKAWNWTWKVPSTVQLHKYTGDNLRRYIEYFELRKGIPDERVIYCDESHFDSRSKHLFLVYLTSQKGKSTNVPVLLVKGSSLSMKWASTSATL